MFEPNQVGKLYKLIGRDVFARSTYAEPIDCPFGAVNMDIGARKTSVRADSSASRGSADEHAAERAKILIAPFIDVQVGDKFECEEGVFVIQTKHVRRSIMGNIDHFECDLEVIPA